MDFLKRPKDILIIDFSQIANATFHGAVRNDSQLSESEKFPMHRYLMLNSFKKLITKFKPNEVVLAIDSGSWRKTYYKYYKARRKLKKEQDDFNWEELYSYMEIFIEEIRKTFPYKVIAVNDAEADDIIAIITEEMTSEAKSITIASGDKDFQQLLKYKNVKLFSPIKDEFIECKDPYEYYLEHVLRGDAGDDIPNMLSDDDVFLNEEKRQKRITKKVLQEYFEDPIAFVKNNSVEHNFKRNKKCIKLSKDTIPADIVREIIDKYNESPLSSGYFKVSAYFKEHNIRAFNGYEETFLVQ